MTNENGGCVSRRDKWKRQVRMLVVIPIIGSLVISYFFCPQCISEGDYGQFALSVLVSYLYWIALSVGNSLLVDGLGRYLDWLHKPVERTIASLILMILYTVFVVFVMNYVIVAYLMHKDFWEMLYGGHLKGSIITTVSIALFISMFFHARGFFVSWRDAAVQNEKLNTENATSKLETLKSQVNPHFLFNSLNALTSLVYDDQQKAVDFIHKLSDVYRYVLQSQNQELVPLSDELAFTQSFVYLNEIRFGKNFAVTITGMDQMAGQDHVPPLALQMLVENCIKHNEISKERPLSIQIDYRSDSVLVSNSLNPIQQEKPDSTGLGLKNITSRYSYLSDREVKVTTDQSQFTVEVPIIKLETS
ncbi:Histidine kinase [Reichenbachiella agariperforans]|uniref:Histidine kinase n=1 Tax=Reichenbachiella agariperforans TaxID=156994 RepID=A0A1M6KWJ3_REIAG|nr:histidine kinase [Reichenbachiella agariperforans]SHJ63259.1 Histidine kinase [Reichenbachiella agariperforans]